MSSKVKIVEQYRDYAPPVDVYGSLRMLLRDIPQQYLMGLHKITLTDSKSVRSTYRGKLWAEKQRIRPSDCRGLYHKGQILLLIDQIFFDCSEVLLLFPPIKTFLIGEVLYHEIGHHIHRIEEPGYRADKEAVADEWKEKLLNAYVRRRYWYLTGAVRLCAALFGPIVRRRRLANDKAESGPV